MKANTQNINGDNTIKEIEEKLKVFKEQSVTAQNVGYALLKAFGMTEKYSWFVQNIKKNIGRNVRPRQNAARSSDCLSYS